MQEGVLGRVMESGKIYVNTGRCVGTSVEVRLYHRFSHVAQQVGII